MNTSSLLRRANPADIDAIAGLALSTAGAPPWSRKQYQDLLTKEDATIGRRAIFVACSENLIRGFCVVSVAADEAELESVVVSVAARRSGLGRLLCVQAFAWAKASGAKLMWLEVRKSNSAALELYKSTGFKVSGERSSYYREPDEDAIVMSAILDGATHL